MNIKRKYIYISISIVFPAIIFIWCRHDRELEEYSKAIHVQLANTKSATIPGYVKTVTRYREMPYLKNHSSRPYAEVCITYIMAGRPFDKIMTMDVDEAEYECGDTLLLSFEQGQTEPNVVSSTNPQWGEEARRLMELMTRKDSV